jgi:hypothetical protein
MHLPARLGDRRDPREFLDLCGTLIAVTIRAESRGQAWAQGFSGPRQALKQRLMGKKLLVSLAMEGKFASDGLQAIDEGDDILMAMARELVTEKGIGESADLVWKQLQRQQAEAYGVRAVRTPAPEIDRKPQAGDLPEAVIPPPAPIPAVVTQLLIFGMSNEVVQRRKSSRKSSIASAPSNQLALYGN